MGEPIPIHDPADPRVSDYVDLTDPDARRRKESEAGFFVGEGHLVVARLLDSGHRVRSVLVTPREHERLGVERLRRLDAPVYVASREVMRHVVGFDLHRGAVAAAERFELPEVGPLLRRVRRVAVLERVNDHENLGVIFRNAAAFGIGAVLLCPECSDPLYRRSVRVSMGHVLTVPFTRLTPWPGALDRVSDAGFTLVALTPSAETASITAFRPDPEDRVALLLGAEGPGLRTEVLERADRTAHIPMMEPVDSLGVASAAAVAFHRLGAAAIR